MVRLPRYVTIALFLGVILSLLLAACGATAPAAPTAAPGKAPSGAATAAPAQAPAQPAKVYELTFSSHVGESAYNMESARQWAKEIETRTNGAVKVTKWAYSEALAKATDTLKYTGQGIVQLSYVCPAYDPANQPLIGITETPYVSSIAGADAMARQDLLDSDKSFQAEFAKNNVEVMFFHAMAPTVIGTNKLINSANDLKGLRYRAYGPMNDAFQRLGLVPVGMSFAEVYEAMQRKTIDGYVGVPMWLVGASKLEEVTKTLVDPYLGIYAGCYIAMNKATYDGMPDSVKKVITDLRRPWIESDLKLMMAQEDDSIKKAKAAGVTFYKLTEAERKEWTEKMKPDELWEKFLKEREAAAPTTRDIFKKYRELVAKYEPTVGYVNPFDRAQ